mmetsp:Transcript_39578/g.82216  ORF Transcript_39578/g.82216 Transcript_39578/m.82216 type:complete len:227 (+) Transcript_39578:257-937(+)
MFFQGNQARISHNLGCGHGSRGNVIFKIVPFFKLGLGDQVVKLLEHDRAIVLDIGDPTQLSLGSSEVTVGHMFTFQSAIGVDLGNLDHTPPKQYNIFTNDNAFHVHIFEKHGITQANNTSTHGWILWMKGGFTKGKVTLFGSIGHHQFGIASLVNGHEPFSFSINFLLVIGPKGMPHHIDHVFGSPLGVHEAAESGDINTTTDHTSHGGKTRIVPSSDIPLFDKPG